ncbi:MAG: efflux RND transporter periplasmic adaptor subunit [Lachnospiraceae bacterium]|nr:efflux RND transporter periplasmic adaptor subunit [Lachnospiraceae bacterium]
MKKWLRNISIGFLAVMVSFTFLSQAAASVTTAVIQTQKAVSGRISHSVSAFGKIESTQEISITVPAQRTVETVYVQEGDFVEAGDALFLLSENQELAEAQEAFYTWETRERMNLENAADTYLNAYESWQKYLTKTDGWYWKSEADHEEDDFEETMRETQYEYFEKYKTYLETYVKWQEDAIENSDTVETPPRSASAADRASDAENASRFAGADNSDVENTRNEVFSAREAVMTARSAYYEYQRSRDKTYQYSRTNEETELREALEDAIADYEEALDTFESRLAEKVKEIADAEDGLSDDCIVYAETAGTVKDVNVLTGDTTTTSAAAVLAVDSENKKVTVTVSAEYEEYIEAGDSVTVTKYGETESIAGATISDIQYDEDDTSLLKVTVLLALTNVSGKDSSSSEDVSAEGTEVVIAENTSEGLSLGEEETPPSSASAADRANDAEKASLCVGAQVTVTFDKQSEQYSMLVPVNAIYTDNDETYVLIVQETEGILGTVLEAQKVTVTVLDKNSSYAAISATGAVDQDIITQSDREVKDGNRVRKQVS